MTNAIKALLQMTSVSLQPVPSLVSQAIYKYIWFAIGTFFLKQKRCRGANTNLNHPV
jgi:hypothetical protein